MEADRHGRESIGAPSRPSGEEPDEAPPGRRRLHPFFRDVSVTLLAQAGVALGGLFLARLIARNAGADGFASYSLVKQAVNILFPIVTVGLVGGLPRYVALPAGEGDPPARAYLAGAALICWGATIVAVSLSLALPEAVAGLFFGNPEADEYVLPFSLLLAATSTFYVAYGYFRGLLRMRAAGLLQVIALGALPPAVVAAWPQRPVDELIVIMALGTAAVSLAAIARPLAGSFRPPAAASRGAAVARLWDYGHRRVPGELAQLGLFVLVPVLAAHVATLRDVAYLSAGQQVLSVVSLAVIPLGLVLLPSLTRMWSEDRERAAANVGMLGSLALGVGLFASIQAIVYGELAITEWLGPEFEAAGALLTVVVAPAGLFVLYLMLRSALDAVAVRSYNSRNNLIALAVFAAVAALLLVGDLVRPAMAVAWAFAAGLAAQGLLTFLTVHRLFGLRWRDYGIEYMLPIAVAGGALALAARPWIEDAPSSLALLVALELVLSAAYVAAIAFTPVRWTRFLAARLFR